MFEVYQFLDAKIAHSQFLFQRPGVVCLLTYVRRRQQKLVVESFHEILIHRQDQHARELIWFFKVGLEAILILIHLSGINNEFDWQKRRNAETQKVQLSALQKLQISRR